MSKVYSVSEITAYISRFFDRDEIFQNITVSGEIANFKAHPTGLYFVLKDSGSTLKCVMRPALAAFLRFKPENGMKVSAAGGISVYEKNGEYQLYVNRMEQEGMGNQAAALDALREKLAAAGYFDAEKKRPLPKFPKKIAIVTAPNSDALKDILESLSEQNPLVKTEVFPATVQGANAPATIVSAIKRADESGADIIICSRGGGSPEDLMCFSDERVVIAFAETKTPIISAIGHESDSPLCDFSADFRSRTPTAAAKDAVPSVYAALEAYKNRLYAVRPERKLEDTALILRSLERRLKNAAENAISAADARLMRGIKSLEAVNPLSVLSRGYAVVRKDGVAVSGINSLKAGDKIRLTMQDGELNATITSEELTNGT